MQTALHIYHLVSASQRELVGAEFVGSEFYRKERLACMFFKRPGKGAKRVALALRFHPTANGLLFLPAGKIEVTTGEKSFPFFQEHFGSVVSSIEQLNFDRIAKVSFAESKSSSGAIIIEALGPSGNLWFLNESDEKRLVLRQRDFSPSDVYLAPGGGIAKIEPAEITGETLMSLCAENSDRSLVEVISKNIAGYVPLLAKEAVSRANLAETIEASVVDLDSGQAIIDAISELTTLAESSQAGYLYNSAALQAAFPFKLKSVDETPEKFPSYSLAELALMRTSKAQGVEENLTRHYQKALNSAIKRQRRSIVKMNADLSEYENYERHKEIADILKANLNELKRGMKTVTLLDLYGEGEITITLEEKLSPAGNADSYYKRYQKGKLGLDILQRRFDIAELELARLQEIATAHEHDADSAQLRFADELAALLRRKDSQRTGPSPKAPRAPYRTYLLTTGLTVYVGRDGSDNDDTTFKHIKPYELWFHASQCPGSHVGLKFPAKSFIPSKTEIEETAAIAAWFSKARKNKFAPVNYTERKYVRKPRKAKAGLVTIERERTVMVEPKEPATE